MAIRSRAMTPAKAQQPPRLDDPLGRGREPESGDAVERQPAPGTRITVTLPESGGEVPAAQRNGSGPAAAADASAEKPAQRRATRRRARETPVAPRMAADVHGPRQIMSAMIPDELWDAYREQAERITVQRKVSTNELIQAVLREHAPATADEAAELVGRWTGLLLREERAFGRSREHMLRPYRSQDEHLRALDAELRARIPGARTKIICATLHFHRPSDDEARDLVASAREAAISAPIRQTP
jgi:hypothetical protein